MRCRSRWVGAAVAALLLTTACSGRPGGAADRAAPATSSTVATGSAATTGSTTSRSVAHSATTTAKARPSRSTVVVSRPPSSATAPSPAGAPTSAGVQAVPAGTTIVLNPGHNGGNAAAAAAINRQVPAGFGEFKACDTTGTESNAGYPEHAFTFDVSLRVRAALQARGVRVLMTRSSDDGVGPCVDERARIGNQAGVAAVISIHGDGAPTAGHGFHVCEDSRQPAGPAVAQASHRLTVAEHDALLAGSGMTVSSYLGQDGYYPRSDLAGLNLAQVPATFLEIGNMRNAGDAAIQSSRAGRQRIADAVAAGILAWLGR